MCSVDSTMGAMIKNHVIPNMTVCFVLFFGKAWQADYKLEMEKQRNRNSKDIPKEELMLWLLPDM